MLLKPGEKVHIITRRLFESDLRRHFVGEVREATDVAARLEGYVFVHEAHNNQYALRPERRVRIFGLADNSLIINVHSFKYAPRGSLVSNVATRAADHHRRQVTQFGH